MVWFEGDGLRFETEPDSRKFKNLVSNPRVAITVFGSPKWGVVVRGRAEVLVIEDSRQSSLARKRYATVGKSAGRAAIARRWRAGLRLQRFDSRHLTRSASTASSGGRRLAYC